ESEEISEPPEQGEGEEADQGEGEAPAADAAPAEAEGAEPPPRERRPRGDEKPKKEEVVPGAHLEPDLVLEEARAEGEVDEYADRYGPATEEGEAPVAGADGEPAEATAERPAPTTALDLAADAR